MSIHSSLETNKFKYKRSVLKRSERLKRLIEKGEFNPEKDSVFGLPKDTPENVKISRKFKKKKEKDEEETEEEFFDINPELKETKKGGDHEKE